MKFKPGETCPKDCQCSMYDKSGRKINQVELKKGDTFPPTPNSGDYYEVQQKEAEYSAFFVSN